MEVVEQLTGCQIIILQVQRKMLGIDEESSQSEKIHQKDKIWREQLKRVENNASLSNIVSMVVAIILVLLLQDKVAETTLTIWISYMLLISVSRIFMSLPQWRNETQELVYDLFGRWYLVAIMMTAAGWGACGVFLFPEEASAQQLAVGFIIAGMASGGVTVMAPVLKLYFVYLMLVVFPVCVKLFLIGDDYQSLSFITLGYLVILMVIGMRIHKNILASLELRFHNESLIKFMSQARNESEDLNEELADEIEQRKRIEKELYKAKEEAEAASKTKSEFLANMSHEIRTPMNGILGTLQLLQGSALTENQKEYVSIAYNSGESLLSLLNDILDFSKIEAGKLELESIPFDVKSLAGEIAVLLSQKAEERQVELKTEIAENIPHAVKGDSVRIRQILSNLITNAIKFTEKGSVTIRLTVLEETEKTVRLKFEIIDTGIGIAEDAQRRLFNSFTQADGSTTRKYGGTGLGLAIVRQLVTLMRGRLGVDSEPGKGSNFWVEIGFELAREVTVAVEEQSKASAAEIETLEGSVLLVEDNPVNQVVARKMLEKVGLSYEVVDNGEKAIERLMQPHEFSLVLMDCQMPVMDGYEATQKLRIYEDTQDINRLPVIAMTANAMEGDKEKCLEAGMDDYISKPVKQQALKETLVKYL